MTRTMPTANDLGPDPEPARAPLFTEDADRSPTNPPRSGVVLVVGYDGSPPARGAVDLAVDRVVRLGGRLVIVHAGTHGRPLDGLLLEGHDRLADLDWEARSSDGSAAAALSRIARQEQADEIVIGSRARGRSGAVLGSTTLRLLTHAPCPVTVVPAQIAERLHHVLEERSERRPAASAAA